MSILDNAIAIMFLSFIVGLIADEMLRRFVDYRSLSSRYLFASPKTYERLGVLWFRKILLATPLRLFNTKICLTESRDLLKLKEVREHIAKAEVSHWAGFVAMAGVMLVAWWLRGSQIVLPYLACNILGNLYPCLLQQYNKRRLARLISILERRPALQGASASSVQVASADSEPGNG